MRIILFLFLSLLVCTSCEKVSSHRLYYDGMKPVSIHVFSGEGLHTRYYPDAVDMEDEIIVPLNIQCSYDRKIDYLYSRATIGSVPKDWGNDSRTAHIRDVLLSRELSLDKSCSCQDKYISLHLISVCGKPTVTSNCELWGQPSGENLSSHFRFRADSVHCFFWKTDDGGFEAKRVSSMKSLNFAEVCSNGLCLAFADFYKGIVTESIPPELETGRAELRLTIPVACEQFWSYCYDSYEDPNVDLKVESKNITFDFVFKKR